MCAHTMYYKRATLLVLVWLFSSSACLSVFFRLRCKYLCIERYDLLVYGLFCGYVPPQKKNIWFFMTDDGQQITLLSDLNSATWQLFFGMFTEAICILLSTSSECEVKSFYLYVVWVLNQHRRSSSHQFNSISKAATGQWFYHSGVFFIIFKALSNVNSTHQMTRFDLNKLNFFSIGLNEIRLNLSDVWYGQLRFTIWFGHNLWIKYCS